MISGSNSPVLRWTWKAAGSGCFLPFLYLVPCPGRPEFRTVGANITIDRYGARSCHSRCAWFEYSGAGDYRARCGEGGRPEYGSSIVHGKFIGNRVRFPHRDLGLIPLNAPTPKVGVGTLSQCPRTPPHICLLPGVRMRHGTSSTCTMFALESIRQAKGRPPVEC